MEDYFINEIMKLSTKSFNLGEVPVGSVVVCNNKILSKGYNCRQKSHNPLNHAEIMAILGACRKKKDWRLDDCELYVTLKPCTMCHELIKQTRIKKVHYLLESNFNNQVINKNLYEIINNEDLKLSYQQKLQQFFKNKR